MSKQFAEEFLTTFGLLLFNHLLHLSLHWCEEQDKDDPRAHACGPQHPQGRYGSLVVPIPSSVSSGLQGLAPLLPSGLLLSFFSMHQNMWMPGKKSFLLMNKVVFFLPAPTFPSWAGILPREAIAHLSTQGGAKGCPGTLEFYHCERAGAIPKNSTWLSPAPVSPPDCPQVTPPAARTQLQGSMGICLVRSHGAGKGKGFYTIFCTWLKQTCQQ